MTMGSYYTRSDLPIDPYLDRAYSLKRGFAKLNGLPIGFSGHDIEKLNQQLFTGRSVCGRIDTWCDRTIPSDVLRSNTINFTWGMPGENVTYTSNGMMISSTGTNDYSGSRSFSDLDKWRFSFGNTSYWGGYERQYTIKEVGFDRVKITRWNAFNQRDFTLYINVGRCGVPLLTNEEIKRLVKGVKLTKQERLTERKLERKW